MEENREHFRKNLDHLREEVEQNPSELRSEVFFLHYKIQSARSATKYASSGWRSLETDYGAPVSRFYRDAVVSFWRQHTPRLRSEGGAFDSTPNRTIIGLSGLEIESRENPRWMEMLSNLEVVRACRFAMFELNGFPEWFPALFIRFPEVTGPILLQELRHELSRKEGDAASAPVIQTLSSSGEWSWEWLFSYVVEILDSSEPSSLQLLVALLKIACGYPSSDERLLRISASKCIAQTEPSERLAIWYAAWVGCAPEDAISSLDRFLDGIGDSAIRTEFAMKFVTYLLGSRRNGSVVARDSYRTPASLLKLYTLMHGHIRVEDDIDRSKGGAYSPGLRDDAQRARDSLFGLLEQIPGKESYLAICEIADGQREGHARSWYRHRARAKAEQDGDLDLWSPEQVRDFHSSMERTPCSHKELAELAAFRLEDLKDDLENGDNSRANVLLAALRDRTIDETAIRNFLGHELREKSQGRYSIAQEEEMADGKRTDLRFHRPDIDGPVPIELKLADKWSGSKLCERLRNQLCSDYLRDHRSGRGIFLLVNSETTHRWKMDGLAASLDFPDLVAHLQAYWHSISMLYPNIEMIDVIGIDLTMRGRRKAR